MNSYIMNVRMYQSDCVVKKELELFSVGNNVSIAALILPGDTEFVVDAAVSLCHLIEKGGFVGFDTILTAEFKGAFLAQALCEQLFKRGIIKDNRFVVARKSAKVYMGRTVCADVRTITTARQEQLFVSAADRRFLSGKRVLLVDDVISTGGAMNALSELAFKCGADCAYRACVAVEGIRNTPSDVISLANIPLFDNLGNEIWLD